MPQPKNKRRRHKFPTKTHLYSLITLKKTFYWPKKILKKANFKIEKTQIYFKHFFEKF